MGRRGDTVHDDAGQAVPLMAAVVAVAVLVVLALAPLGRAAIERSRAVAIADAVALAGAAEGEAAARELAAANGAELTAWQSYGGDTWVEVRFGDARAEARARREGRPPRPP
jgi:hypothetical protein